MIGRVYWVETSSEFLIGKVLMVHKMMSFKMLIAFVALELCTLISLDTFLTAWCALGRNMTINEFKNVQDYRHLFVIEAIRKGFDDAVYRNDHKKVSCCRFLVNPFLFFFPKSRR